MSAIVYTPSSGLMSIHNTARVMGTNVLTTEGMDTITDRSGPLYNYAIGVIVPAVVMIVMFIIWGFSLICAKCCCKGGCSKHVALTFFVVFCCTSLIGWAIGLAGNVNTTKGFNAMLDGISAVQGLSLEIVGIAEGAADFADDMFALANSMAIDCQNDNVTFPLGSIADGLNSSISSAIGSNGVVKSITDFNKQIDTYKDEIHKYIGWREVGTMIVIIVTMVVLTIFMVTTALRVMDSTPESCRPCMKVSSRGTSCIVFLFGILLLLIIWIFVALIHLIVTIGADVCVPSINTNLDRLANEVMNDDFSGNDPCLNQDFLDSTAGIICYYQTCTGPNKLDSLTNPIRDNTDFSQSELENFRTTLEDFITNFNVTVFSPQCFPSMDAFFTKAASIGDLVNDALDLTTCDKINPVYAAFVYNGICNGMIDGLVFTYVSCIIAAVFMMLAMSIFRIFDFNMYEYGRLPEGFYVDKANGQVVSTGGPITQAV